MNPSETNLAYKIISKPVSFYPQARASANRCIGGYDRYPAWKTVCSVLVTLGGWSNGERTA